MASHVVVTGVGVISPIGCSTSRFWSGCLEGRSGVRRLDSPWVTETDLACQIGAPVDDFDPARAGIEPKQARVLDRTSMFALGAAGQALADAGFEFAPDPESKARLRVRGVEPSRLASVVGSGIGGITSLEVSHAIWRETRSKAKIKRYSLPMLIPNAPAGWPPILIAGTADARIRRGELRPRRTRFSPAGRRCLRSLSLGERAGTVGSWA